MTIYMKIRDEIGFLEFFQKSPGGSHVAAKDEPPGGTNIVTLFFGHFWYFWGTCDV